MESVIGLQVYLERHGVISVRDDLFKGRYTSLRTYQADTKAGIAKQLISGNIDELIGPSSTFWTTFIQGVRTNVATSEGKNIDDIAVSVDEFSMEGIDQTDALLMTADLLLNQRIAVAGRMVLDIEGVTSWPIPDPDLEFNWTAELKLIRAEDSLALTLRVNFVRVQGPNWGKILGIIGLLIFGQFSVFGAAAGVGVGEVIDLQYSGHGQEQKVIDALGKVYMNVKNVVSDEPRFQFSRPDERSLELSMRVHFPRNVFARIIG